MSASLQQCESCGDPTATRYCLDCKLEDTDGESDE
jgi:hypothetical protein